MEQNGRIEKPVISMKQVVKRFESAGRVKEVVDPFNLDVRENEFVVLFGPGQCGKTTLINLIAGLELPSEGEIWVDGRKVEAPGPDRGVVYQTTALFPFCTVMGNVEFGPKSRGIDKKTRRERAQYFIDLVGLQGFEKSYPNQLSGGMRQRVGIAMGMTYQPRLLLADEPTSALDVTTQAQIVRQMMELREEYGTSIILVTHNLGVASYMADKIVVMKNGKIEDAGDRSFLLSGGSSDYTKRLLDAVPSFGGVRYV